MATLVQTNRLGAMRIGLVKKRDNILEKILPRPCMIYSGGLILAGLLLVLLMLLELLPLSLWLFLAAFMLTGSGSVLAIILYGEI